MPPSVEPAREPLDRPRVVELPLPLTQTLDDLLDRLEEKVENIKRLARSLAQIDDVFRLRADRARAASPQRIAAAQSEIRNHESWILARRKARSGV